MLLHFRRGATILNQKSGLRSQGSCSWANTSTLSLHTISIFLVAAPNLQNVAVNDDGNDYNDDDSDAKTHQFSKSYMYLFIKFKYYCYYYHYHHHHHHHIYYYTILLKFWWYQQNFI